MTNREISIDLTSTLHRNILKWIQQTLYTDLSSIGFNEHFTLKYPQLGSTSTFALKYPQLDSTSTLH